jgi:hypothetical protein
MRYYDITITPEGSTTPLRQWSSHPNGTYDPGALEVEFDMPILPSGTPSGGQSISIHGVPLQDLSQAYQFASTTDKTMNIVVSAGMKAGFPLANPSQAGVILSGQIFQAFGNWKGTEMSLDLVVYPPTHTLENPGNFVLNWQEGQPLADALKQTLSVVYPRMPISINISPDVRNNFDCPAFYPTLEGLAEFIGQYTEVTFHNRVEIVLQAGKLIVFDKSYTPPPIQLAFNDFIGQPTWIETGVIQLQTVMRADLEIGAYIRMPQGLQNAPGFTTSTAGAALTRNGAALPSTGKDQTIFQNNFQVIELRHIGSYRTASGEAWSTIFNAVTSGTAGSGSPGGA